MTNRKQNGLKLGMLGVATTGLLWQAIPASAQTANSTTKGTPAQVTRPLSRFDVGRRGTAPRRLAASQNANSSAIATPPAGTAPTTPAPTQAAPQQNVLQTSAANGGKTDVQKQLEALYQADGREMPEMTFNLQPINPQGMAPQQSAPQQQAGTTNQAAAPAASTQQNVRRVQGYTQYQPGRSPAAAYPAPAAPQNQPPLNVQTAQANAEPAAEAPKQGPHRPNPVLKFFKKLNGSNRAQAQTSQVPVPPDYASTQPSANQPPATLPLPNRPANVSPAWSLPPQTPATMPPALSQQAVPIQPAQPVGQANPASTNFAAPKSTNLPPQNTVASTPHRPGPRPSMIPTLSDSPMPIQTTSARGSSPKPKEEAQSPSVVVKKSNVLVEDVKVSVVEKTVDFPNPFPEGSEVEADVKIRPGHTEEITPPATVAITPKSEAEAPKAIEPPAEVIAETPAAKPAEPEVIAKNDEDNPFAVDAKDFLEPIIVESRDPSAPSLDGEPALVAPADDAKPAIDAEPLAAPAAIEITEESELVPPTTSPLEKMKRIRERFGMKGLKGFCPVSLREDRELVDARPEFTSTHRGQRFHFATEEARDKFEEAPSRYVPAAYGADVVALSRDKDVLEGTLDFAAWYKGRLYLFGSQENYDAFIAEPTLFATIDGLE